MSCINKKERLKQIIKILEFALESDYWDYLISDRDIKMLEVLLGIKPYSKVDNTEVKKISGRGLKCGKKKSHN